MLKDLDKILDTILEQSQPLAEKPDVTLLPRVITPAESVVAQGVQGNSGDTGASGGESTLNVESFSDQRSPVLEDLHVPTVESSAESSDFGEEVPEGAVPAPEFFGVPETSELGVSSSATDLPGPRSGVELDASESGIPVPEGIPATGVDLPDFDSGGNATPDLAIPAVTAGEPEEAIEVPEPGDRADVSPEIAIPAPEGITTGREELPSFTEFPAGSRVDIPKLSEFQTAPGMQAPQTSQQEVDFGDWAEKASSGIADRLESRITTGMSDLYGKVSHYIEDRLTEEMLKLDRRFTR